MRYLLDASALIALAITSHEQHDRVAGWAIGRRGELAVSPIVEGALVRFVVRQGGPARSAVATLEAQADELGIAFWPDDLSHRAVDLSQILGHKQVTDTYLVALARHHGARLATLDQPLADRFPGDAVMPDGCSGQD